MQFFRITQGDNLAFDNGIIGWLPDTFQAENGTFDPAEPLPLEGGLMASADAWVPTSSFQTKGQMILNDLTWFISVVNGSITVVTQGAKDTHAVYTGLHTDGTFEYPSIIEVLDDTPLVDFGRELKTVGFEMEAMISWYTQEGVRLNVSDDFVVDISPLDPPRRLGVHMTSHQDIDTVREILVDVNREYSNMVGVSLHRAKASEIKGGARVELFGQDMKPMTGIAKGFTVTMQSGTFDNALLRAGPLCNALKKLSGKTVNAIEVERFTAPPAL